MRILLVETNEDAIQSLKPLLRLGHKIFVSKSGKNGLMVLEKQDFDLLMIDVELVENCGIELLVALRQKERLTGKHLPVVALGSLPSSGRIPGMEVGFDYELRKPIQHQQILAFLDELNVASADSVDSPPKPAVNEKAALALCDSDEELFHEILEIFLTDASSRLEKLEDALKSKDTELTVKHAHALKGAAGNICAEPFQEIVTQIERAGKNKDLSGASLLFDNLSNEFNRLSACAKKILLSKK